MESWIECNKENIVISSRVRLARNLKEFPFPNKLTKEEGAQIGQKVRDAFMESVSEDDKYNTYNLWEVTPNLAKSFVEKHLISPNLVKNSNVASFIVDNNETISLMINEEDHIRLQCISGGYNIREVYEKADTIDSLLENKLEYAFHEKLGYLTACPTNLGTAMRVSVMVHLPALTLNNEMNKLLKGLAQVGMTIRGLYGEGSKGEGNLYQISNQVTLGVTDEDILNNLEAVTLQVVSQEKQLREIYLKQYKYELEDKVFRARALLESSRILTLKEGLSLLSNLRLGVELGIIEDITIKKLNKILIYSQNATLQNHLGIGLKERDLNIERANIIRKILLET
ncbi:protein arginine kinase [Clostridium sp. 'White wine YQ']|uniref:protein arginine kinase n=1 Tax=Clostridium sp. 'White wine YQ' TaxID=3027474 RepID=UPI0023661DD5|nr:protein arginine kinase [Clostridium sp. 'White wine YQ']MDD7796395.1 protein arginine kinase [Clostridium sp. 'White wine YQ']